MSKSSDPLVGLVIVSLFTVCIMAMWWLLFIYVPNVTEHATVCDGKVMSRGELIDWIVNNRPEVDIAFKSTEQLGSLYNRTVCGVKEIPPLQ